VDIFWEKYISYRYITNTVIFISFAQEWEMDSIFNVMAILAGLLWNIQQQTNGG